MRTLTPAASNKLTIENESDKPLFVTFTEQGVPQTTDQTVTENNLTMKVDYTGYGAEACRCWRHWHRAQGS